MKEEDFSDILYQDRPASSRIPMDIEHRAKQFAPFAALKGYEEALTASEAESVSLIENQVTFCLPEAEK